MLKRIVEYALKSRSRSLEKIGLNLPPALGAEAPALGAEAHALGAIESTDEG
ncbi:hypothetical protein A2U01_0090215, partial [Trifolium medium]|nr:hypothetical protein [Trifolium medium]